MMTTYNRERFIAEAIESVLKQTYKNWELLILDDASKDSTSSIVAKYTNDPRIKYLPSETNLGITKNRNRGFHGEIGKYIAVLDSDDLWLHDQKLAKQVEFIETHGRCVAVGTNVVVIDENSEEIGAFLYETNDKFIRRQILLQNQFTHSSLLIRSSVLNLPNPYNESTPIWEDYELILQIGLKGELANLPEKMTAYRKHENNISKTAKLNGAKVHLSIIRQYKNKYPNFFPALLKGYLRVLV